MLVLDYGLSIVMFKRISLQVEFICSVGLMSLYDLFSGHWRENLLPLLSFDSFQVLSMRYSERTNVSAFILLYFEVDLNSSHV